MSPERFDQLLSLVTPLISKKDTKFRKSIPLNDKWAPCLNSEAPRVRRIAKFITFSIPTGKSHSLKDYFRLLWSYLSSAARETFTKSQITGGVETIAQQFEDTWNMHIGAINGEHVQIKCPRNTGSLYHNYKGFSLVVLAICGANYFFMLFDVGQYRSNNGSGVLIHSNMGGYFENHSNNIPRPESVEGCDLDPLPYFLVGYGIFPLKTWLMRPYPGKLAEQERIFNYCLSWARRVIESCFGILAARWRVFSTPIETYVVNAERYTLACIALHNCLRETNNPSYCPNSFVDCKDSTGDVKEGEWMKILTERNGELSNFSNVHGSCYKDDTVNMRCCLIRYLNGERRVDWQLNHVRRTQEHIYLLPKNSYVQSISKN